MRRRATLPPGRLAWEDATCARCEGSRADKLARPPDGAAARWLLARRRPKVYGERQDFKLAAGVQVSASGISFAVLLQSARAIEAGQAPGEDAAPAEPDPGDDAGDDR